MTQELFHNKDRGHSLENYISENCVVCGKELTDIKDIMVDVESDQYICTDCCKYHGIYAVKCMEYWLLNIDETNKTKERRNKC